MPLSTIVIDAEIPSTTALYTGNSHLHTISLQSEGDCYFQFFKTDGTTELTGKIHLSAYEIYNLSVQGDGLVISNSGIKLTVGGNVSGKIRGFISGQ